MLFLILSRPGAGGRLVFQLLHVSLHFGDNILKKHKSEKPELAKYESTDYKSEKHKSDFYKSVLQLMSSKSSQVNNLALGGYSWKSFFFESKRASD